MKKIFLDWDCSCGWRCE